MARTSPTVRKALADVKACEAELETKSAEWLDQLATVRNAQQVADVLAGERADAKNALEAARDRLVTAVEADA